MEFKKFTPEHYKNRAHKPEPPRPALAAEAQKTVYLHPGHLFVSPDPTVITTVLGSCVTICLWDMRLGIGGANHYMLPSNLGSGQDSLRFGDVAVPHLLDALIALGSQKRNLRARVFGGASVIKAFNHNGNCLGAQNVELAYRLLRGYGIPVIEEDVEGTCSRKVMFHTRTGQASVRRL